MTKAEHINYWKETALMDWSSSEDLFKTNHYLQALFFAHLSLEKICKAIWILHNETNHPPRIHNLVYLLRQTKIEITNEQLDFLLVFNDFQLEGRYPDYKLKIYKSCDAITTQNLLEKANKIKIWLLNNLPSRQ